MGTTRRQFLTTLTGMALLAPAATRAAMTGSNVQVTRYLSARADREGHYYLTGFDESGTVHFDLPLPARGHAIAVNPIRPHVVQVARRPGRYLLVVDASSGEILHRLANRSDRHFRERLD